MKASAFELYLTTRLSLDQISKDAGVELSTLKSWITQEGWVDRRKTLEDQAMKGTEISFREFISQNRLDTAKNHVETARELIARIKLKLSDRASNGKPAFLSEQAILSLSKALKEASDVEARAVGLDKSSAMVGEGGGAPQRVPMLIVGLRAERVSSKQPDAIDITSQVQVSLQAPDPF